LQIKVTQVYGGVGMDGQISQLHSGTNVIVATPGRFIDLWDRRHINLRQIKYVILDEADRMLDMGFLPDMETILLREMAGLKPVFCLFSATLFEPIKELGRQFTEGNIVDINVSHDELTVESCSQFYLMVENPKDKISYFLQYLWEARPHQSIVFVNSKKTGEWLFERVLNESQRNHNLKPELISGDLTQGKREEVLRKFKGQNINLLIATDVASRGLDIPSITHVINFDLPKFEEDYVHRIGRTSRMEKEGCAITLTLRDEYRWLCRIEGFTKKGIKEVVLQKPPQNKFVPKFRRAPQSGTGFVNSEEEASLMPSHAAERERHLKGSMNSRPGYDLGRVETSQPGYEEHSYSGLGGKNVHGQSKGRGRNSSGTNSEQSNSTSKKPFNPFY
jgi:ATP-dependent RNA helicase DeaD